MDNILIWILRAASSPVAIAVYAAIALTIIVGAVRRRPKHMLPSQRTSEGRSTARKTAVFRVLLVAMLIPYAVATALFLPRDVAEERISEQLPNASSGLFVVDVSGSISERNKTLIRDLFQEAADRKLHVGLILFAGDSYVLWGPNVPAEEVTEKMATFFDASSGKVSTPTSSVWNIGGGTEMIEGMLDAVAMRSMLIERGAESVPIILVSDLQDFQQSRRDTLRLLGELKLAGEEVYVVDLNATRASYRSSISRPYRTVLGGEAFIQDLSALEPVVEDAAPSEALLPIRVHEGIFAGLAAALLLMVLADAFLLPRMPLNGGRRRNKKREEE